MKFKAGDRVAYLYNKDNLNYRDIKNLNWGIVLDDVPKDSVCSDYSKNKIIVKLDKSYRNNVNCYDENNLALFEELQPRISVLEEEFRVVKDTLAIKMKQVTDLLSEANSQASAIKMKLRQFGYEVVGDFGDEVERAGWYSYK